MSTAAQQVENQLLDPLKNSLAAGALSIAPGMLTEASKEALAEISKIIAQDIGENVEEELNAEDMFDVADFGPDTDAAAAPQNQNTGNDFTPNPEDDIIDQNPQKSRRSNNSSQEAGANTAAPEGTPYNQFDDDQETADHNASQGNLGEGEDDEDDESAGDDDSDGGAEAQGDQGQQQKLMQQMEALEQNKQTQIAPERQKLAPLEKEKNSLENKKLAVIAQEAGMIGMMLIIYMVSALLIIISLPLMIFGIGFGIFGAAMWLVTWGKRVYNFKMRELEIKKRTLSELIKTTKEAMKPHEAKIAKIEKENNAQIRALMSQYRTSK